MRHETRQRKHAMAGLRAISGEDRMLGTLVRVIGSGKQALDAVMLEMGRMVAESIMLIEREELADPDYYPTHPGLQKWAYEAGSAVRQKSSVSVGSKAVPACCSICCRASLMGRDVRSGFSAVRSSNTWAMLTMRSSKGVRSSRKPKG